MAKYPLATPGKYGWVNDVPTAEEEEEVHFGGNYDYVKGWCMMCPEGFTKRLTGGTGFCGLCDDCDNVNWKSTVTKFQYGFCKRNKHFVPLSSLTAIMGPNQEYSGQRFQFKECQHCRSVRNSTRK